MDGIIPAWMVNIYGSGCGVLVSAARRGWVRRKETELPKISFNDLRQTAATLMFKQGVHPKIVQERLGHGSISLTFDTYSHAIPTIQEEIARKLDEILN